MAAAQPLSVTAYLAGRGPLTLPGGATGLAFSRTKFAYDDPVLTRPDIELVMGAGSLAGDLFGMLRSLLGNFLFVPTKIPLFPMLCVRRYLRAINKFKK